MDENSSGDKWTWRAVTRKANLSINEDGTNVTITWITGSDKNLTTNLNYKGRAMELSDISEFAGRLLSPDDKTGMLYDIKTGKAVPWLFLNSGPGNTTKGMKAEWTTVFGGHLIVGGHGTEYRNQTSGAVLTEDPMWIKVITNSGEVRSCDWRYIYKRFRRFVNLTGTGAYLTHEAAQWSSFHQKWFFLPRRESNTTYNEEEDEKKGTNLMIIGNPNLTDFEAVRIGNISNSARGHSAFEFIPGTNDTLIVALKSEEIRRNKSSHAKSFITVFNISGYILLDDQELADDYKFEGLYFVDW
ncbi:hypothetical protein KIN20_026517 [Parelaphostrongylus tenuis]|nr:hypothetical protein KIN20_026517 [Parelaphostrongylus tenuis]